MGCDHARNTKIDQLYIARKNVLSVVSQIRFINELPERLKVMTTRLNEDYTCLKVVYDEWIGYYSWMQKLKTQISAITYPDMQVSLLISLRLQQFAEELYGDCFESILALRQLLEDKLWEHIYRCLQLGQSDPAALVRALTIIEKNQRRHLRAKDVLLGRFFVVVARSRRRSGVVDLGGPRLGGGMQGSAAGGHPASLRVRV